MTFASSNRFSQAFVQRKLEIVAKSRLTRAVQQIALVVGASVLALACESSDARQEETATAHDGSVTPAQRYTNVGQPVVFVVDANAPSPSSTVHAHAVSVDTARREAETLLRSQHHAQALEKLDLALTKAPAAQDERETKALRLIEIEVTQAQLAILQQEPALARPERLDTLAQSLLGPRPLPLAEPSAQALVALGDLARARQERTLARASYMQAIRLLDQLRRYEIEHPR